MVRRALLGAVAIARHPAVLEALNPLWAVRLFLRDPTHAFLVLGAVVLCVTGGEALYADLGYFGRAPIRRAWLAIVFPALVLNYLGQGAWLLEHGWVEKPFWAIVPRALLYPMVVLATATTVIASQALISGVFSLSRQATQLGYFPRVTIRHTSEENERQIYIPEVNAALMVACLALVLSFGRSSALAGAYGVAVTGTMTITSVVFFHVVTRTWAWSLARALPLVFLFLSFDVPYLLANLVKLPEGGWLPIAIGVGLLFVMTTWKRGRAELAERFTRVAMPLTTLLEELDAREPRLQRVPGTAVFMSSRPGATPPVLLHHLKHNHVLHEQVVLLSIVYEAVPHVPREEQLEVKDLGKGCFSLSWRTGFMETPNVPAILKRARKHDLMIDPATTSYFIGRETLLPGGKSTMNRWRKVLFAYLSRNALPATKYFHLPPGRVIELGIQVDL